jgi:hypothetical protein
MWESQNSHRCPANPFLLYTIEAETGFAESMSNSRNVA